MDSNEWQKDMGSSLDIIGTRKIIEGFLFPYLRIYPSKGLHVWRSLNVPYIPNLCPVQITLAGQVTLSCP